MPQKKSPAWGWVFQLTEKTQLNNMLLKLYVRFQDLKNNEDGQDLVEYALVVAVIAFGATAGMSTLADGINSAFNTISSNLLANL
jgi:pilus assembly protein Flp/PilA